MNTPLPIELKTAIDMGKRWKEGYISDWERFAWACLAYNHPDPRGKEVAAKVMEIEMD